MHLLRNYYYLTKPGIVYGNVFAAIAGFFLGVSSVDLSTFLCMVFGIGCIVASGCVFNNYIDRDIDIKMERTKTRSLVTGEITRRAAIAYGSVLALTGIFLLMNISILSTAIALFGLFMYVFVYSLWCKRYTLHATLIGAVAGAVPPVVGYTAATGHLDLAALVIFLVLFTWQMPHALAIAIRRARDYEAASIPVMPLAWTPYAAKIQMAIYVFAFMLSCVAISFLGLAGYIYGAILGILGVAWFGYSLYGFAASDDIRWAKSMFLFSIVTNLAFCGLSLAAAYLPL